MARYQVILAYDGTGFSGFQRQASGIDRRTVQAEVEAALRRLGWSGTTILAAGRTDAGVHASGQVIAFDLDWAHGLERLQAALNANLPPDVAAGPVQPAADDFHPRYAASLRRYRYRLFCSPVRNPLRERYAWRVWPALDADRLHRSAQALPGEHDFAAFGSPPKPGGSSVRQVMLAEWRPEPPDSWATQPENGWLFEIAANAFLFHMVRRIVGLSVAIGQGRVEPEEMQRKLQTPAGPRVRIIAPPHGLALVEVAYPARSHSDQSRMDQGNPAETVLRENLLETDE